MESNPLRIVEFIPPILGTFTHSLNLHTQPPRMVEVSSPEIGGSINKANNGKDKKYIAGKIEPWLFSETR